MNINDIANVKTETIINNKEKSNVNDITLDFKFTSKTKRPFRIENSDKKYIEKIKNDNGFDIAFPCSNYYSCFGYKFQVIFGKEIKESK